MGEQLIKGSVKKFMFIYNFLRGFFTMKVVENSPQNAQNCTIFRNFLGGGGMPPNPLVNARRFADRDMPLRVMYITNPKFLSWPPPSEKSCIRLCMTTHMHDNTYA